MLGAFDTAALDQRLILVKPEAAQRKVIGNHRRQIGQVQGFAVAHADRHQGRR
ncbi:Uncharacterised protein [Mycobacteroides abscessus subsp. abscessus]|nr:Uncharacterised protein [Mycobacteroides abscessus subsp. abscessus]